MSFAGETASSVMRTLEFLIDKHCKSEESTTAPRVPVTLLAAVPRIERKVRKKGVPVTPERHDEIYAEAAETLALFGPAVRADMVVSLAAKHDMSTNNIRLIISRRHCRYDPMRTERYVRRRVKIPA